MLSSVNYRKFPVTHSSIVGATIPRPPTQVNSQNFQSLNPSLTKPTEALSQKKPITVGFQPHTETQNKTLSAKNRALLPTPQPIPKRPPYFSIEPISGKILLKKNENFISETIRHLNDFWGNFIKGNGVVLNDFLACLAYNYDKGLSLDAFKSLEPAKIAFMIRYIDEAEIYARQALKSFHPLRIKLLEILKNNQEVITYKISNANYHLAQSFPYAAPIKPIPLYKHDLIRTVYPDIEAIPPHICGNY